MSFIDFNNIDANSYLGVSLLDNMIMNNIGATYNGEGALSYTYIRPLKAYDGLIFINEISESKLLQ